LLSQLYRSSAFFFELVQEGSLKESEIAPSWFARPTQRAGGTLSAFGRSSYQRSISLGGFAVETQLALLRLSAGARRMHLYERL